MSSPPIPPECGIHTIEGVFGPEDSPAMIAWKRDHPDCITIPATFEFPEPPIIPRMSRLRPRGDPRMRPPREITTPPPPEYPALTRPITLLDPANMPTVAECLAAMANARANRNKASILHQNTAVKTSTVTEVSVQRDTAPPVQSPGKLTQAPKIYPEERPEKPAVFHEVAAALGSGQNYCALPNGEIVPYIDLGNGYIAIPTDKDGQPAIEGSGFAAGVIATESGIPTVDKPGGVAGGGSSGPVTSPASKLARELTGRARLPVLRPMTGTGSVGGSIGRALPFLGPLESFLNFLNMQDAYKNVVICRPVA